MSDNQILSGSWNQFLVKFSCFYLGVISLLPALALSSAPNFLMKFPGYNRPGQCNEYYARAPSMAFFFCSGATLITLTITLVKLQRRTFTPDARFMIGFVCTLISMALPTMAPWLPYNHSCVGIGIIVAAEVIGGISCATMQSAAMAAAVVYGPSASNFALVGMAGICFVSLFQAVAAQIADYIFPNHDDLMLSLYFGSAFALAVCSYACWTYLMEPTRRQMAAQLDIAAHVSDAQMANDAKGAGWTQVNEEGMSRPLKATAGTSGEVIEEHAPLLLEEGINGAACHVDRPGWTAPGADADAPCAPANGDSEAGLMTVLENLWRAIKPIWPVALGLYICWLVSMSVYPGQLAGLHSPFHFEDDVRKTTFATNLFLCIMTGLWGCCDCIARAFTPMGRPEWAKPLLFSALLRATPLYLLIITVCPLIITSPFVPIGLTVLGGATNGIITTLAFSTAIASSPHNLHDLTASAMSFILNFGNTSGALLSLVFGLTQLRVCPASVVSATVTAVSDVTVTPLAALIGM